METNEQPTERSQRIRQTLHRVDASAGPREKLFVPIQSLVSRVPESDVCGERITPWMELNLLAALQQWAQHQDQSLRRSAEKVVAVSLPQSMQGWRFHPWLGFNKECLAPSNPLKSY